MGKSKDPFYVAAGLLVAWALLISMGIGMRRPSFPANGAQQRALMAVSVVLVIATVSMAVVVSGGEGRPASAAAATTTPSEPATSASTQAETTPAATGEGAPKATTGTPAPPSSPAAGKTTKVSLSADAGGQLAYNTKALTAKAGTVSIAMTNASPLEHNVTIAEGTKVLGATPTFVGGSKTVTLKLKPGKYTFYCSVPGHRQAGMEGTLTVTS
jgi:plastocyanin